MKINTGTNKNQAQSRKFNIAQLTRNVSTPVFRGSVRKLCAHLFTRVLELFHKTKCLNFHEMLSKKTHLQLEAEEDRNTHSEIGYVQQPIGKQEFRSATWVFMFSSKLNRQNGCTVLATTKYNQAVCALRLRCIVDSKFSRWRRRSRNFAGYLLYFSIDTVLSLDRFSRFHMLIIVQIFSVKKNKSIFFISI